MKKLLRYPLELCTYCAEILGGILLGILWIKAIKSQTDRTLNKEDFK